MDASRRTNWWPFWTSVLPLIGTSLLAGRLVWEQTVWTWERGPQMVGFSLAHGSGAILLLAPLFLAMWALVVLSLIIINVVKHRKTGLPTWITFGAAGVLFAILLIPAGLWQRIFIQRMASSPRAGDLLIYAAYDHDKATVEALLKNGVGLSATDRATRRTVLHAAASAGDLPILEFLVSRGADVNALDRSGDSPVELAAANGHNECVRFLEKHGGRRMRGDEEQRRKAREDRVRETSPE